MTTSGDYSFNPTATDLITDAYRDLNIIEDSESCTAAQLSRGIFLLNSLCTTLQATGIHVWTEQEAILFLQPVTPRYTLGGPGVNSPCADAYSWKQAALANAVAGGSNSIVLVSAIGINNGDNIGVVLDAGPIFWTTVNGAPAGNTVTLTLPLPSSASSGNVVAAFPPSAQITRPLKVPKARLYTYASQLETPFGDMMSRQEYMDTPNKLSPGTPTQAFYDPQRDTGYFFVWPVPILPAWAVRFTWYRSIQDVLTLTNTMDFPREWGTPLRWLLAEELKVGNSVPVAKAQMVKEKAAEWMEVVSSWDRETQPIQFGLDWTNR